MDEPRRTAGGDGSGSREREVPSRTRSPALLLPSTPPPRRIYPSESLGSSSSRYFELPSPPPPPPPPSPPSSQGVSLGSSPAARAGASSSRQWEDFPGRSLHFELPRTYPSSHGLSFETLHPEFLHGDASSPIQYPVESFLLTRSLDLLPHATRSGLQPPDFPAPSAREAAARLVPPPDHARLNFPGGACLPPAHHPRSHLEDPRSFTPMAYPNNVDLRPLHDRLGASSSSSFAADQPSLPPDSLRHRQIPPYRQSSSTNLYSQHLAHDDMRSSLRMMNSTRLPEDMLRDSPGIAGSYESSNLVLHESIDPELARTREGSLHWQRLLDSGNMRIKNSILTVVCRLIYEIMRDQHGHQVFIKLLDVSNEQMLQKIVKHATRNAHLLFKVACTKHGSSSVMMLIEKIKDHPGLCRCVTVTLTDRILDLMKDPTGNSLIRHCFATLKYDQNSFLFEAALEHCQILARDQKRTSESLMLCINNAREGDRKQILYSLALNTLDLAQHEIGNYAIQYVINLEDPDVNALICDILKDNFATLCRDKSGSYVLESLLNSSNGDALLCLVADLPQEELQEMAQHPVGNYIVKKAVEVSKKDLRIHHKLVHGIRQILDNLTHDCYTNNLRRMIRKLQ